MADWRVAKPPTETHVAFAYRHLSNATSEDCAFKTRYWIYDEFLLVCALNRKRSSFRAGNGSMNSVRCNWWKEFFLILDWSVLCRIWKMWCDENYFFLILIYWIIWIFWLFFVVNVRDSWLFQCGNSSEIFLLMWYTFEISSTLYVL